MTIHLRCNSICFLRMFLYLMDPAPSEISTLSLHDALPIYLVDVALALVVALVRVALAVLVGEDRARRLEDGARDVVLAGDEAQRVGDRKSTRLNSSHVESSYAVFCLKKKK